MADDRRAEAGGAEARLERYARTRRKHLFHREDCGDRRAVVPADRGDDDGFDAGGICQNDAERRPASGRKPQQVGMEYTWLGLLQASRVRIFRRSAPPGTTEGQTSLIGARYLAALSVRRSGSGRSS